MAYGLTRSGALKMLGWLSMQWHAVDVQLSELHRFGADPDRRQSLCRRISECAPGDLEPFVNLAFEPALADDAQLPGTDTNVGKRSTSTLLAQPSSKLRGAQPATLLPMGSPPLRPCRWYRGRASTVACRE